MERIRNNSETHYFCQKNRQNVIYLISKFRSSFWCENLKPTQSLDFYRIAKMTHIHTWCIPINSLP